MRLSTLLLRVVPLALLALLVIAPALRAQSLDGERTIRSWVDEVKLDDGSLAEWLVVISYNPTSGEFVQTTTDASGAIVERIVTQYPHVTPNGEELERAQAIILNDPELRTLYDSVPNAELSGGFTLFREQGHPCHLGSRCLQFDMYYRDQGALSSTRLRYVVVNLRDGSIVSRDFDPSKEGNETRFNSSNR